MKVIEGGVTAAARSLPVSTAAEIKYKNRQDMAMIHSKTPCKMAGIFIISIVKAALTKWDQNMVRNSSFAQAVVVNAGTADACTRAEGYGYCKGTADVVAEVLEIPADAVLAVSARVTGMQLPMDRITAGAKAMTPKLDGNTESGIDATQAIMITDTKRKKVAMQVELGGGTVTIGDMCKGSGMIYPNMCIMLAFVTMDAAISKELLQEVLSEDIQDTYDMMSVDGDALTNDTMFLLTSGMPRNPEIIEENKDYETFKRTPNCVNKTLAKKVARDDEGCAALFGITIVRVESKEQARILAKSVTASGLIKATIFDHDVNWGRILCATGYSGAIFDPERADLFFRNATGKMWVIEDGTTMDYSEEQATKILSGSEVTATADVKMGGVTVPAWGCDLAFDYVKINTDYYS